MLIKLPWFKRIGDKQNNPESKNAIIATAVLFLLEIVSAGFMAYGSLNAVKIFFIPQLGNINSNAAAGIASSKAINNIMESVKNSDVNSTVSKGLNPSIIENGQLPSSPDLSFNFVVSTLDVKAIALMWTDLGNAERYELFRKGPTDADFVFWQNIPGAVHAYTDQLMVEDGSVYGYRIFAYNINGSTSSNFLLAPVPIAPPGDFVLSYTVLGGKRIKLNWTRAPYTVAGGKPRYTIFRDSDNSFGSPQVICSNVLDPLECLDNLPSLVEKFYVAAATNDGGSIFSDVVDVRDVPLPVWREINPNR